MTTYDGDEDNYPTSLTIPDDGDVKDAASILVATEGIADRTAWLRKHGTDQIFDAAQHGAVSPITISNTSPAAVSGLYCDTACEAGDLLMYWAHYNVSSDDAPATLTMAVYVTDDVSGTPAGPTLDIMSSREFAGGDAGVTGVVAMMGRAIVTKDGTTRLSVYANVASGAHTAEINGGGGIMVLRIRNPIQDGT